MTKTIRLSDLPIGGRARVVALHLEGAERRRLLDLGLAVGSEIVSVRRSPLGDPIAYEVRGACLALRREQAQHIEVQPC